MGVSLSTLRVVGEFDAGGYLRGMADKVSADKAGVQSAGALVDAQGRLYKVTDYATSGLSRQSRELDRLQRGLDTNYRAASELENAQRRIQRAVDMGGISQVRANELLAAAEQRYHRTRNAVDQTSNSLGEQRIFWRTISREAALVGGPLGQVISHFGMLSVGSQRLSLATTGTVLGFAAVTAAVYKSIAAYIELEKHQATVSSALQVSQGASGQTPEKLQGLTTELSKSGTLDLSQIRSAQLELLRFRNVSGDVFADVMRRSQDLASTGFTDLRGAVMAFGKALSDPVDGLKSLQEAGVRFSPTQAKMIADFAKAGQLAKAQQEIMKIAAEEIGGADAKAADTLSAAWQRMSNSFLRSMEDAGRWISESVRLKAAMDALADSGNRATDKAQQGRSPTTGGDLSKAMSQRGTLQPAFQAEDWNSLRSGWAEAESKIDGVRLALEKERREAGMTETAVRALHEQHAAGVAPTSAAGRAITGYVNSIASIRSTKAILEQIKEQIATSEIEIRTFGMSTSAAAGYRVEQEALARERIKGVTLSQEQIVRIHAEAQAYEGVVRKLETLRNVRQASDAISAQSADALFDWASGARSASDAFSDLARSIARMAFQAALAGQGPLAGLAGTQTSGGLLGSGLQSLLRGFAPGGSGGALPLPGEGAFIGPVVAHSGGVIGSTALATRQVPQSLFQRAPRYHLGIDEVPAILQTGERVIPRGGSVGGAAAPVNVSLTVNNSGGGDMSPQQAKALSVHVAAIVKPLVQGEMREQLKPRGALNP